MIYLRVSDLDQWVKYVEPEREEFEVSTEEFLAYMRRETGSTPEMDAGKALHKALEFAVEGNEHDCIEVDGEVFHFDGDFVVRAMPEREGAIIEKVYQTMVGPVLLRGRIDARDADSVTDYKLTFSAFDGERYAESLQWRAYLDMTGARRFNYEVFEARRAKDGSIEVREQHPLVLWRYEGISADVHRRVSELAQFVAVHVPSLRKSGTTVPLSR